MKVRARVRYQRARPDRLRQPEFPVAFLSVLQPRGQPVDGGRRLGHIGQQALDALDVGGGGRAGHVGIGTVGVDDASFGIGDQQALTHRIDERLRQFVGGRAWRDLDEADCGREQEADADHRQHAEHAEQERIAQPLAEKPENDGSTGQHDHENDKPDDRPRTGVLVDDRNGIKIAARLFGHAD